MWSALRQSHRCGVVKPLVQTSLTPLHLSLPARTTAYSLELGKMYWTSQFLLSEARALANVFEQRLLRMTKDNGFHRPKQILTCSASPKSPATSLSVSEINAILAILPDAISEQSSIDVLNERRS